MYFVIATAELNKVGLVQDLAAVMLVAGLVAALFHYFKWPKVIGYIAAGALMGIPYVKGFLISNEDSVNVLANLGVIFLMFTLGLELNIRKLRKAGGIIFPSALFDMFAMLVAGYALGKYCFHLGMLPSLFLGAMVCDSSTTLLAKSLDEMGCSKENFASIIFGITISEDVMTIGVMAVLTGLAITGQFQAQELFAKLGLLGVFLVAVLVFGVIFLPRFLNKIKSMKDDETLLVIILGICFGIAFIAEKMEYSLALGAFLVGAVVAESSVSHRVHESTGALRSMFSAVFFVTIGLMVHPLELLQNWCPILVLSILVIVCKTLNCSIVSYLMGQPHKDALKTGVGLAQIGDFSYMIALLGLTLNHGLDPYPKMYQIAVGTSVLTTLLNPFLLKKSVPLGEFLERKIPQSMLRVMENYTEWVRRTGSQMQHGSTWTEIRRHLVFYIIDMVLMAAVFFLVHYLNNMRKLWDGMPSIVFANRTALLWIVASIVTFIIAVSAYLHGRNFSALVSETIVPDVSGADAYRALKRTFKLIITLISISLLLIEYIYLSTLLTLDWRVILGIFVLCVLARLFCWKKIKNIAKDCQASLHLVIDKQEDAQEIAEADEMQEYRKLSVSEQSGAVGLTLAQIHLRNRTGATIAQIRRKSGKLIQNPSASTPIKSGDTLYISANDEQFANAEKLLESGAVEANGIETISEFLELRIDTVQLQENMAALGKSLRELRIRNVSGATVVRIQQSDGTRLDNPGPDVTLNLSDRIYLLGNATQLADAKQFLTLPQNN